MGEGESRLPRVEYGIWWCGDEVCDCVQPYIELLERNPADSRFIRRTRLWEGTFHSQPEPGEVRALEEELAEELDRDY